LEFGSKLGRDSNHCNCAGFICSYHKPLLPSKVAIISLVKNHYTKGCKLDENTIILIVKSLVPRMNKTRKKQLVLQVVPELL
jgi:hypothetical protein